MKLKIIPSTTERAEARGNKKPESTGGELKRNEGERVSIFWGPKAEGNRRWCNVCSR